MIRTLADFAPETVEAGVGLALQDTQGRYVFFLAGRRHRCPPSELFYAGIGGHRELGETWLDCARREAREEIGAEVKIVPSSVTWHLPHDGPVAQVEVGDKPRPFALYEMIHRPDAPRAGEIYRIVVYRATLTATPVNLQQDEVQGVIALTLSQVKRGIGHKPTLKQLLDEGAFIVAGAETLDRLTRLYPIGTAAALARIMQHIGDKQL